MLDHYQELKTEKDAQVVLITAPFKKNDKENVEATKCLHPSVDEVHFEVLPKKHKHLTFMKFDKDGNHWTMSQSLRSNVAKS